jgi:hypothetical protein
MSKLTEEHKNRFCKYKAKKAKPRPRGVPMESVEDFLARGGKIEVVPKGPPMIGEDPITPTSSYNKER